MEQRKIYEDIALRTEGDIYIGVVGPVRTGKSTFIKRFMETMVIANIDNVYRRRPFRSPWTTGRPSPSASSTA